MSSNPAPNTIFALLYDYIDTLNYGDDGDYADTLHTLYENTDLEHQRIIINLFTTARVARSPHDTSLTDWEGRTLNPRAICPITLTLTMRALTRRVPLTVTKDQQEKHFTPELLKTLQSEVDAQNQWRTSNPYTHDASFSTYGTSRGWVEVPALTYSTHRAFQHALCRIILSPPRKAPLACHPWRHTPLPAIIPEKVLPGAAMFSHQAELYTGDPDPQGWATNLLGILAAHSPDSITQKILDEEPLTSEDYHTLAAVLEDVFPVREYAYRTLTGDLEGGYRLETDWLLRLTQGEIPEVIREEDNGNHSVVLLAAAQKWVHEHCRPAGEIVYESDTYTL